MQVKGIDISKWQGEIDFNKVKKDGIKFVIIRAGSGKNVDPMFSKNYKGAKEANIPVGVYWYSYAKTVEDALTEAKICKQALKGCQLEYPVFYDVEEKAQFSKGANFINAIISAFCQFMEKDRYFVGVYMSKAYAEKYLSQYTRELFTTWIAQYNTKCHYKYSYGMWQFASTGKVNGVKGDVDLDFCFIDYPKIIVNKGFNGYEK